MFARRPGPFVLELDARGRRVATPSKEPLGTTLSFSTLSPMPSISAIILSQEAKKEDLDLHGVCYEYRE